MKYHIFPLLFALLIAAGCSGKVPLTGTVTFSDDGSPLPQGVIYFQSDTLVAQGGIQPDGTFRVGTDKTTDGLPPGTYRVYIGGAELSEFVPHTVGIHQTLRQNITPLIDTKYNDPATSGLSVEVDNRTRTFDIQVDRAR
ncbi:MAG: carboxypeptidase-like regulatory domain-containing protein [Planctomycetaceae bacterium]|nr:carboxypeptidase-like regulatory domain-containing protein [Planctomycetaceae bacterium]